MAFYETGTATGTGALNNFFQAVRSHLTNNSWTEHDVISNVAGSRDILFRSAALDATADIRAFVRLTQTSTTAIQLTAYSDWDTSTHTGINTTGGAAASCTFTGQDASFVYYVWLDSFGGVIAGKISTSINRAYIGFPRRGLDPSEAGITKASGTLTAGATSISVASDMTGKLRVGQKVQVMNYAHASANANAAHSEAVTITSIAAGSIGISALANNYDSGAVIGENVCPTIVSGSTTSLIGTALQSVWNLDGTHTGVNTQPIGVNGVVFATEANVDPGDITSRYGSGVIGLSNSTTNKTDFKGYPRGAYFCASGTQVIEDIMAAGPYTFLVMDTGAAGLTILGPREI